MRALTAAVMAAGLAGLGLAVVVAGRTLGASGDTSVLGGEAELFGPPIPAERYPLEAEVNPSSLSARAVAPSIVAPPPVKQETLVRASPRDPLGPLGQAQPPRKKEREGGNLLYRPVATGSATFEAMGYRLAIAGTESVDPAETCTYANANWPCGIHARTAVRLWLRGRALACDMPPKIEEDQLLVIGCRLGTQDVGAWLVANGWAHASKGGPYAEAEAKARAAGIGIFGAPPPAVN
jgi:endonuclease YncB( thermonuclease family)